MDAVLAGDAVDEQLGVGLVGLAHGIEHQAEQGTDDAEARQFDVEHVFRAVYFLLGQGRATGVGLGRTGGDVPDERSAEGAVEQGGFMVEESSGAFADEQADDTGAQVGYLLVVVVDDSQHV